MSNNNNTNDPRITQTIIYLVLWILNMLKKKSSKLKKKCLAEILGNFRPRNKFFDLWFLYLWSDFSLFFCFVCFDDILLHRVSKAHFGTNPRYPMHIIFRCCGGVTPSHTDHIFSPYFLIFFLNNMVKLI